jgi:hypothetical protein
MILDVPSLPQFLTDSDTVTVGLGALLLAFGRRLYFLVLGVVGFAFGLWLSTSPPVEAIGLETSPEVRLLIALGLGVLSAGAAFVLHRVVLGAAGLAIGGAGGFWLAQVTTGGVDGWAWLWPVGGALAGAILLPGLYHAALVVLSAWVGTALLVQAMPLEGPAAALAALGLFGVGVVFQAATGGGRGRAERGPQRGRGGGCRGHHCRRRRGDRGAEAPAT